MSDRPVTVADAKGAFARTGLDVTLIPVEDPPEDLGPVPARC
jgi:hypothetical protein